MTIIIQITLLFYRTLEPFSPCHNPKPMSDITLSPPSLTSSSTVLREVDLHEAQEEDSTGVQFSADFNGLFFYLIVDRFHHSLGRQQIFFS